MSSAQRVLYFKRAPHDSYLVFVSTERALFVDQIHRAIEESKTWGEFRQRLPAGEYHTLYQDEFTADPEVIAEDDSPGEPADDEAFPNDVPGYSDGDYPPWLVQEPYRHLPAEILEQFSTRAPSFINGAAFPVSSLLLGLLADSLPGSYIGQFVRQFATHTALTLLVVAGFLQSALAKARAALNKLSNFDAQLQRSIDQQLEDAKDSPAAKASQAAEADLLKCQQAVIAADSALNEASVKLAAARQEFESGTARGRLNAFVRAKVIDGEYAKHLGIIASIRKDFVQLASLMHATDDSKAELVERQKLRLESVLRVQRFLDWLKTAPDIRLTAAELYSLFALLEPEEAIIQFEHHKEDIATHFEDDQQSLDAIKNDLLKAKATPLPRFSRIVLYIDDLDRCPPAKVVDVLQAVHLLLCFPLFVVIVAVDARWVSRALHERFPNLLAHTPFSETLPQAHAAPISGASSDDYLEKIFQIPYWVRPLEATAAATYVHEIAKTDRIPIAVPTRVSPATLGVIPPVTGTAGTTSAAPDAATAAPILGPSGPTASVGANPGVIAPASDATELAVGMSLGEWEIDALRAFAPFVGRTPRHAIRFVNIYRLIKTTLSLQVFDASSLEQGIDARSRPLIPDKNLTRTRKNKVGHEARRNLCRSLAFHQLRSTKDEAA
jgi:hypothetical protein